MKYCSEGLATALNIVCIIIVLIESNIVEANNSQHHHRHHRMDVTSVPVNGLGRQLKSTVNESGHNVLEHTYEMPKVDAFNSMGSISNGCYL